MELHSEGGHAFSEEEMFAKYKIDRDKWEAIKLECSNWETPVKRSDGEIAQILNHRTKLYLKRKYPEIFDDLVDILTKKVGEPPKQFHREQYEVQSETLGQVILTDAHIDQMDTKRTSISQRKRRIINGTKELLKKLDVFEPEKLLYTNLGDFFNSDGGYKTTKGTEQQNIMPERDAWEFGIELQVEILELMSKYAPTMARFIAGNHDENRLGYLQDVMYYYFLHNPNVDISTDKGKLQFFRRGNTMFGYDHGHSLKPKQLAEQMVANKPTKNTLLESYRGHEHHKKTEYISGVLINNLSNAGLQSEREKGRGYQARPSMTGLIHNKKGKVAELREGL